MVKKKLKLIKVEIMIKNQDSWKLGNSMRRNLDECRNSYSFRNILFVKFLNQKGIKNIEKVIFIFLQSYISKVLLSLGFINVRRNKKFQKISNKYNKLMKVAILNISNKKHLICYCKFF